jgi:Flp pilus assembly pilin Flp
MQSPNAIITLKRIARARFLDEAGQDLLEYGFLMALIAIVAMTSVGTLGSVIHTIFWDAIAANF